MLDLSIETMSRSRWLRLKGVLSFSNTFNTSMRLAVGLMPFASSLLIISCVAMLIFICFCKGNHIVANKQIFLEEFTLVLFEMYLEDFF